MVFREDVSPSSCFANPKSRIFGVPLRGHHDVFGFQVPVDEAAGMGSRQAFRDLPAQADGFPDRQRTPGEPARQGLAFHQLEDDGVALVTLHDVVDLDDRRVRQAGRGARLAAEALARRLILRGFGPDELDRHPAVQPLVVGLVDLPHSTSPEPFAQAVGTDRLGTHPHALTS